MYNFFLGGPEAIRADPQRYLLAIKRMLPRWLNSLPDSSYVALRELIVAHVRAPQPVFVETGVGASTILLMHCALELGGRLISWDANSAKASALRQVMAETLEPFHGKPLSEHWTFVSSDTLCPHLGLPILAELTDRVDLSMHDSDHTSNTVSGEIGAVLPFLTDGAVVCVDDANQDYIHTYEPIINVGRRKLGLNPIAPLPDNRGKPHSVTVPELLARHFKKVESLSEPFSRNLKTDPYYRWYEADRASMDQVGMERLSELESRIIALRVSEPVFVPARNNGGAAR